MVIQRYNQTFSHDGEAQTLKDEQKEKRVGIVTSIENNIYITFDLIINLILNILRLLPIVAQLIGPPKEYNAMVDSLISQQKVATSYRQWKELSKKLDTLMGNEKWKDDPVSDLYDYKLIQARTQQLRTYRLNKNYKQLLYIIRTTFNRNLGNIGNVDLYKHSFTGTKSLIEEYLSECKLSILELMATNGSVLDDQYLLGMLIQTRKAIGRTALVLSGGGCFGLLHIGVLSTLLEQGLLPKVVSGSSAGAIVASILSVHAPEEIVPLLNGVFTKEFIIFDEPGTVNDMKTIIVKLLRFCKTGNIFDISHLKDTMKSFLGNLTFREAYNRTGRILNITVSPENFYEQPTLLNYVTSPDVVIWSAVVASCSLPGVFSSNVIYEKTSTDNEIRPWNHDLVKFLDGSVDHDLPITRLSELFNVNHIIACQVNPHVVPLLKLSINNDAFEHEFNTKFKNLINLVYNFTVQEITHYLDILQELGIARNLTKKFKSLISQKYSGNITILPDIRITEIDKLLSNPTPEFIVDAAVRGARSTWPKVDIIYNHCFIEFLLDKCILDLRVRLILDNKLNMNSEVFVNSNSVTLASFNEPIINTRSPLTPKELPTMKKSNSFKNSLSIPPSINIYDSAAESGKKNNNEDFQKFEGTSSLSAVRLTTSHSEKRLQHLLSAKKSNTIPSSGFSSRVRASRSRSFHNLKNTKQGSSTKLKRQNSIAAISSSSPSSQPLNLLPLSKDYPNFALSGSAGTDISSSRNNDSVKNTLKVGFRTPVKRRKEIQPLTPNSPNGIHLVGNTQIGFDYLEIEDQSSFVEN